MHRSTNVYIYIYIYTFYLFIYLYIYICIYIYFSSWPGGQPGLCPVCLRGVPEAVPGAVSEVPSGYPLGVPWVGFGVSPGDFGILCPGFFESRRSDEIWTQEI